MARTWLLGMQDAHNQERFDDAPTEEIYAFIIINEVRQFISIMYAVLIRFYLPIVPFDLLNYMYEDLIEIITSLTID